MLSGFQSMLAGGRSVAPVPAPPEHGPSSSPVPSPRTGTRRFRAWLEVEAGMRRVDLVLKVDGTLTVSPSEVRQTA